MRYLLIFALLGIFFGSCRSGFKRVDGNGNYETRELSPGDFSQVEVSGSFKVIIKPSPDYRVVVDADENLHPYIRIDRDGSRLKIRTKNNVTLRSARDIKVTLYMNELSKIELAGSGDVVSQGQLESPGLMEITIAGSGDADLEVKCPEVKASIGGSGKIVVRGKTRDTNVRIAGSGDFIGNELLSENAEISIAGSGNAKVYSSINLVVKIAGSGNVYYAGNPTNVKKNIAGMGLVQPME